MTPHDNSDSHRTSIASTKADFRELRANSSATVQELQEFLREFKGRSPQEMLGVVATSQLFRATVLSTILVALTIVALTAAPYYLGDKPEETEPIAVEPAPVPTPAPAKPAPAPAKTPEDKAPKTLGVDQTLTAPANSNPLEDKKEDFLKDLE
jgi:hypothetical protein